MGSSRAARGQLEGGGWALDLLRVQAESQQLVGTPLEEVAELADQMISRAKSDNPGVACGDHSASLDAPVPACSAAARTQGVCSTAGSAIPAVPHAWPYCPP